MISSKESRHPVIYWIKNQYYMVKMYLKNVKNEYSQRTCNVKYTVVSEKLFCMFSFLLKSMTPPPHLGFALDSLGILSGSRSLSIIFRTFQSGSLTDDVGLTMDDGRRRTPAHGVLNRLSELLR